MDLHSVIRLAYFARLASVLRLNLSCQTDPLIKQQGDKKIVTNEAGFCFLGSIFDHDKFFRRAV